MDWYEHYEAAKRQVTLMEDSFPDADFRPEGDWVNALRSINAMYDHMGHVAVHCAQEALNAGATKKAIAVALGVTPSTLRDLRKGGAYTP